MNKLEFTRFLSSKYEIPIDKSNAVINIFIEGLSSALEISNEIQFMGFGKFYLKNCRNPKTNQKIRVASFKAGKSLKETTSQIIKDNDTVKTQNHDHVVKKFPLANNNMARVTNPFVV